MTKFEFVFQKNSGVKTIELDMINDFTAPNNLVCATTDWALSSLASATTLVSGDALFPRFVKVDGTSAEKI